MENNKTIRVFGKLISKTLSPNIRTENMVPFYKVWPLDKVIVFYILY